MQGPSTPTEEAEASIPTDNVREDPNLNHTVRSGRKAATRTLPWDLVTGELHLVSRPPKDEDIPAKKKPRLEGPLSASPDEVARKTASSDVSIGLPPPPPPAADVDDANAESVMDTQPNAGATGRWTLEEDAELTRAVANTPKKKYGKEYRIDWIEISALVTGRATKQCWSRWHDVLDCGIDQVNGHATGRWTKDEDRKLKDALHTHGEEDWVAVAALVPGRSKKQCWSRSSISITLTAGHTGKWTEDEDSKLKDAVQTHGDKDWKKTAALIPGRTKNQCRFRWRDALNPIIDGVNARKGNWTEDEDSKLKDAIQKHGAKKWGAVFALVPGRTKKQCWSRWHDVLNCGIDRANVRKGKWAEDEDSKLKDAVQTHGDKDWDVISALVPGRKKIQCRNRWNNFLDPRIDRSNEHRGKWEEDEDSKLKDAVQTHGENDWIAVAALVPGRTKKQCWSRWHDTLKSSITLTTRHAGIWTAIEQNKLEDAVRTHGDRNWNTISELVPGRTKKQCSGRWQNYSRGERTG
jgi:hypothetical protein